MPSSITPITSGLLLLLAAASVVAPDERTARLEAEVERIGREERLERAARAYAGACAACHGTTGRGDGPGAADLVPPPRDFTTGGFRFRSTPSGAPPRNEDLVRTIREGLPGSSMPAFGGLLADEQIAELAELVRSMAPPREPVDPVPLAALPPADSDTVREGHALYLLLECWRCHGLDGEGRGPASRGLTDTSGRPVRATDFRHDPLKGGRDPLAVARALLTGLDGTPMPSYGEALVFAREDVAQPAVLDERLSPAARNALDEFLGTLPTRADLGELDQDGRGKLGARRLAALSHYVLSLDRRRSAGSWLFHQRPEREARKR